MLNSSDINQQTNYNLHVLQQFLNVYSSPNNQEALRIYGTRRFITVFKMVVYDHQRYKSDTDSVVQ
jgi:hypothetical protein